MRAEDTAADGGEPIRGYWVAMAQYYKDSTRWDFFVDFADAVKHCKRLGGSIILDGWSV